MAEGNGEQIDWLDGLVQVVREIHEDILRASGGVSGEHTSSLYSAIARPFHSAFGEPIYSTSIQQAAALFHAIIRDHAFVDGNKRTGTFMAMLHLSTTGTYLDFTADIHPSDLQVRLLGDVALETASTGLTVEQVAFWIERIFAPPA